MPVRDHIVVLVHGMNSSPRSMRAIEERFDFVPGVSVLNVDCNVGFRMTEDGIVAGGERLADAVLRTVPAGVDLSFVGVSLGGLYARYCIGAVGKRLREERDVRMMNYVSFVTPHVGLRGVLPAPFRAILWLGGGATGSELLLVDDARLLRDMADGSFLSELACFRRRVMVSATEDVRVPSSSAFADYMSYGCGDDEFSMACDLRAIGWERLLVDYREGFAPWYGSHSALHKSGDVLGTVFDRFFSFGEISDR